MSNRPNIAISDTYDHFYHEGVEFYPVTISASGLIEQRNQVAILYQVGDNELYLRCDELDNKMKVEPYSLIAIRLGQPHALFAKPGEDTTVLQGRVPIKNLSPLSTYPSLLIIHQKGDKNLHRTITQLLTLIEKELKEEIPSSSIIRRLAEIISIELARYHRDQQVKADLVSCVDTRLNQALTNIHTDPSRHWSLKELAQSACMSRSAFASHFRKELNTTPHQYRQVLNLGNASMLLRNTQLPLGEIGLLTGFNSDSAFIKAFRKHFSETPSRYRKSVRALLMET